MQPFSFNIRHVNQTARLLIVLFVLAAHASLFSQDSAAEKIKPSIKLSYRIAEQGRSVRVEISHREGKNTIPAENLIVNLYLNEVKKYNPATGEGWMSNMVTDEDGVCVFDLTDNFKRIKTGAHTFKFIAGIATDPRYENSTEEITMNDYRIDLRSEKQDSVINVRARLVQLGDSGEKAMAKTEMKLLIKRTFGMLPFGEDNLTTDDSGYVSGIIPADVPGNGDNTITVVGRFEDMDNDGIIEGAKSIAWNVPPFEHTFDKRTLWSTGSNAPVPLVVISVSIILVIWGTIFYLIYLLLQIKKAGKNSVHDNSNQ